MTESELRLQEQIITLRTQRDALLIDLADALTREDALKQKVEELSKKYNDALIHASNAERYQDEQLAAMTQERDELVEQLVYSEQGKRNVSEQLTASQDHEQQLREALEAVKAQRIDGHMFPAVVDMNAWHTKVINALALPHDTTVLDRSNKLYAAQELVLFGLSGSMTPTNCLLDRAAQLRKEAE